MSKSKNINSEEFKQLQNFVCAVKSHAKLPPVPQELAIKLLLIISNQNLHPKGVD